MLKKFLIQTKIGLPDVVYYFMKTNIETNFDKILKNLSDRFDSNPYSLSQSEIQMLKWFSQNPGYLSKSLKPKADNLIKTGLVTAFIKKNLRDE